MEGVAFAIRDCLEVAKQNGVSPSSTNLCGGGARNALWRQIMADVLNIPVHVLQTEQGPSYGAAILAMVGCGEYVSVEEATKRLVKTSQVVVPQTPQEYQSKYEKFTKLYPLLKQLY